MKKTALLALALALPLSACNTESTAEEAGEASEVINEARADSVETVTDEGSDAMEETGEMEADSLRDAGNAAEDAGEATDPAGNVEATEDDPGQ